MQGQIMTDRFFAPLDDRGLLHLSGPDLVDYLQGLVSNDVARADDTHAIWSAFLTPQGKFLHDFFLVGHDGGLLLDGEGPRRADLLRRLKIYKLRSKVDIADRTDDLVTVLAWGADALDALGLPSTAGAAVALGGGRAFVDPRLEALGARVLLPRIDAASVMADLGFTQAPRADHDRLRIALGIPDGSRDMEVEKAILLENGFDELHGVDWRKGCYMGQELTARTKYRGLVKKRLLPVEIDGPAPAPGTALTLGGREAGVMRSSVAGIGLALIRLEYLEKAGDAGFTAGDATLHPAPPSWLSL
jgi:folate-binding protein YgfZ